MGILARDGLTTGLRLNASKKTYQLRKSNSFFLTFKRQPHKMFKHTQTIRRQQPIRLRRYVFKHFILTLPTLCILESCLKIKINLNFYFDASLWCLKRFYEGL